MAAGSGDFRQNVRESSDIVGPMTDGNKIRTPRYVFRVAQVSGHQHQVGRCRPTPETRWRPTESGSTDVLGSMTDRNKISGRKTIAYKLYTKEFVTKCFVNLLLCPHKQNISESNCVCDSSAKFFTARQCSIQCIVLDQFASRTSPDYKYGIVFLLSSYLELQMRQKRNSNGYPNIFGIQPFNGALVNTVRRNRK